MSPASLAGSISATRISRRRQVDQKLSLEHLGSGDIRWQWPDRGLNATLTYSLNRTGAREYTQNYVPVTDGYGNYRLEDSVFIPDPTGDYILAQGNQGALETIASAKKTFIFRRS